MASGVKIWVGYAAEDKVWLDRMVEAFHGDGLLELYRIEDGLSEIAEPLEAALEAVLLLSEDFLRAGFFADPQILQSMEHRETRGHDVKLVILRPCGWRQLDVLPSKPFAPRYGEALSELPQDLAARELEVLAETLLPRSVRSKKRLRFDPRTPLGSSPSRPTAEMELGTLLERFDADLSRGSELRWLQGQVYEKDRATWARRVHSFRAGKRHQIRLRIGPGGNDWISLPEPFDETHLAAEEEFHVLQVILASTVLPEQIQMRAVQLPANGGPSTEARFEVSVPEGLEAVEASITVLYKNQHLQGALLRGRVVPDTEKPRADEWIALLPGQASQVEFSSSSQSKARWVPTPPDLLLHWSSNQVILSTLSEKKALVPLHGIEPVTQLIRDRLRLAAVAIAQSNEKRIDQGAGLDLLRVLAAQGSLLRNNLLVRWGGLEPESLKQIRRVQVVSPFSAEYLPVEFFYDGPTPQEDARLCPRFELSRAKETGCTGCQAASLDSQVVCPLLFWGLNRTLERQIRLQSTDPAKSRPSPTQVEPSPGKQALGPLGRILLAASHRVSEKDRLATLEAARGIDPQAHEAKSWEEWKEEAETTRPGLLVAVPHNVMTSLQIEALEIGESEQLLLSEMETRWPCFTETAPVVLLLGCNTAMAEIPFHDFVDRIRCRGAAVVVGTLTPVLGQHSAPVAQEFLFQLGRAEKSDLRTFGEVLRHIRCRMLRAGNPMALALVAYGGSQWVLPEAISGSIPQAAESGAPNRERQLWKSSDATN